MTSAGKPHGISISWLLIGGVGGIVLAGLLVILFLGLNVARDNTNILLLDKVENLVNQIEAKLAGHLEPAVRFSDAVGPRLEKERDLLAGPVIEDLLRIMAPLPQIRGVGLVLRDGRVLEIGREGLIIRTVREKIPNVDTVDRALQTTKGVSWGSPFYVEAINQAVMPVRRPLFQAGKYIGFLTTAVTITDLSRFIGSLQVLGGKAFVLYGKDHLLAHPILEEADLSSFLGLTSPLLNVKHSGDKVLFAFRNGPTEDMFLLKEHSSLVGRHLVIDDEDHVVFYREIAGFGPKPLIVGAHLKPSASDIGRSFDRIIATAWVGLAVLTLVLVAAFYLTRLVRRPVRALARASEAVRNLDFEGTEEIPGSFVRELDEAASAYNRMIVGLRWFETYVPRTLVTRLMRSDDPEAAVTRERRVTVMFTDIVGFTRLSQSLGAREVAENLNAHFTHLNAAIEETGGTLDKYIGDSVMAFWGAPVRQEDQATRACEAARMIARSIGEENRKRQAANLPPLHVRLGIHTGRVVAGNIGAPGRINYTVVGDTVNVANRLEQLGREVAPEAEVSILVSAATVDAAGEGFDFQPAGSHQLRGRSEAITVHRLTLGSS